MQQKQQFNWVLFWLLGCVTCGIYPIYVFYKMTENNNEIAARHGEKAIMNYLLAFLLTIVTCGLFNLYWLYTFMAQQVKIAEKSGVQVAPTNNAFLLVLLSFVPIYSFYLICDNYNRTVQAN